MNFVAPPFDERFFKLLLDLNNANAENLNLQTAASFQELIGSASFVRGESSGLALLVAFNETCTYGSPNFAWMKARYAKFNYIDRVVVDERARGRGMARALYQTLEDETRRDGRERLVCEIYSVPPNPQSDAFHQRLGFSPVGEQELPAWKKTVRYWARELGEQST